MPELLRVARKKIILGIYLSGSVSINKIPRINQSGARKKEAFSRRRENPPRLADEPAQPRAAFHHPPGVLPSGTGTEIPAARSTSSSWNRI